jgi:hypothetical protein
LVPRFSELLKYFLSNSLSTDLLASFTMVSAASHSTTDHKIVELCFHTAQAFAHHACAEDGYLKCPHPPNIDGDIWWDSGWVFG